MCHRQVKSKNFYEKGRGIPFAAALIFSVKSCKIFDDLNILSGVVGDIASSAESGHKIHGSAGIPHGKISDLFIQMNMF